MEKTNKKKFALPSAKTTIEVIIRLFFFLLYPALFSTAFTGIKMVVEQIAKAEFLPWNSFVMTLIILLAFTIFFGRFFCGFACAFGSYGDFIYFLSSKWRKKRKKKPFHVFEKVSGKMRYLKYLILLLILLLCIRGAGSLVALHSPFGTFSRLHALKQPESMTGLFLFILITAGMALEPRFFCRFLCPMGAVFSLLPVFPFSVVKRNRENCIRGCKACQMICPANLDIPSAAKGDNHLTGECFACSKCIHRCPRQNIKGVSSKKYLILCQMIMAAALALIFWLVYG